MRDPRPKKKKKEGGKGGGGGDIQDDLCCAKETRVERGSVGAYAHLPSRTWNGLTDWSDVTDLGSTSEKDFD